MSQIFILSSFQHRNNLWQHFNLYLENDGSKRPVPLQAVRGRNASLRASPQLLHSLAHHPPEPVYHQAGREVASIQRLRRAQRGDGAFT